jgi:hypothetical protein
VVTVTNYYSEYGKRQGSIFEGFHHLLRCANEMIRNFIQELTNGIEILYYESNE